MSECLSSPIKFTNSLLTFLILSCLLTVIKYLIGGLLVALTNVTSIKKINNEYIKYQNKELNNLFSLHICC